MHASLAEARRQSVAFRDRSIENILINLERAINCVPTGELREKLCDANILVMEVERRLKEGT